MCIKFLRCVLFFPLFFAQPLFAQTSFDSIRISYTIEVQDSVRSAKHQSGYLPLWENYTFFSDSIANSLVSGNSTYRLDKINGFFSSPDEGAIPEVYNQTISVSNKSTLHVLQNFSIESSFSDPVRGWYSNQYFFFDSIELVKESIGYRCKMNGSEMMKHGFAFSANRGSIYPNIPQSDSHLSFIEPIDNESFELDLYGTAPLTIRNNSVSRFSIYPNPATNVIFIMATEPLGKIEILDFLGHAFHIKEEKIGGSISLDVSALAPGIYIIRCGNDLQKIIIAR